jgi:hypothetical protein
VSSSNTGASFRVWLILARSVRSYFLSHPFLFAALSVVYTLPSFAVAVIFPLFDLDASPNHIVDTQNYVLFALTDFIFGGMLRANIIKLMVSELAEEKAPLTSVWFSGFINGVKVLGVLCLVGVLSLIGSVLLLIPGWIVAGKLWFAVPAFVVERRGTLDSVRRSWALTKGRTLRAMVLIAIVGIGTQLVLVLPMVFTVPLFFSLGDIGLASGIMMSLGLIITYPFIAIVNSHAYVAAMSDMRELAKPA